MARLDAQLTSANSHLSFCHATRVTIERLKPGLTQPEGENVMREDRPETPMSTADIVAGRTNDDPGATGRSETPSEPAPMGGPVPDTYQEREVQDSNVPLLPQDQLGQFQGRWTSIQSEFVDEPKAAVTEADSLVAEVIQQLAERFANQRSELEQAWSSGSEVSTEDLRLALQHYRSFFHRLLAA
jgi:hypothetical protein